MAERRLLGIGAGLTGEDAAQLRRDQQYAISLAASALESMSHLSAHEKAELAIRTYLDSMAATPSEEQNDV